MNEHDIKQIVENALRENSKTTDPIHSYSQNQPVRPEWGGYSIVKQQFDLGRTYTYYLEKAGKIKGVLLRNKGSKTGKKLFYLPSIGDFLKKKMEESV